MVTVTCACRVWDVLMVEGMVALHRSAAALLQMVRDDLLATKDIDEVGRSQRLIFMKYLNG